MFEYIDDAYYLVGPRGRLPVSEHDEITRHLAMLYEGQCEKALVSKTALLSALGAFQTSWGPSARLGQKGT